MPRKLDSDDVQDERNSSDARSDDIDYGTDENALYRNLAHLTALPK